MASSTTTMAMRLAVTVGLLLILVFLVADPREVWTLITNVGLPAMIGAILLSFLDRIIMAYKWWLLLRARELTVTLWMAVRCYLASSLYGLVLPVTVGADAVRVLAFRNLGMMEITASIVIERSLGVIAMGTVGLLSCLLLARAMIEVEVRSLALWLTVAMIAGTALFTASLWLADRWTTTRSPAAAPSLIRKAVEAYGHYRRHPVLLTVFYLLSVGESLLSAVIAYVVAIGLGVPLPLYVLVATIPIALASARLPISLGGFGVQEASFVFLAGLVGVSSTNALTIMLIADIAMLIALLPSAFETSMLTLRRQAVKHSGEQ